MDISLKAAELELVPASLYGGDGLRLKVGGYVPLAVYLACCATLLYLALVHWPKNRHRQKDGTLDEDGQVLAVWRNRHNIAMFVYSGIACAATLYWMVSTGQITSWEKMCCQPVEGTYVRVMSVSFTLSKLYEWVDTMFLIKLGKRRFNPFSAKGFLHIYHHATTFTLFCFVLNFPGPEKMGMLLNGFVHFLMYNHYWKSWTRVSPALITVAQILQLAFVIFVWVDIPSTCARYSGATSDPWFYLPVYGFAGIYLFFFVVFFIQRFICPSKKKKKDGKGNKDKGE